MPAGQLGRTGAAQAAQVGADQWPRPTARKSAQLSRTAARAREHPRPPELPLKRIKPMTQQTLTRLRHLKLTGMADAVQQQLEQASTYEGLPFIERLSLLVEHEQLSREQRKQARLVKQARLKLQATVQEVDYQSARNLERSQVANLAGRVAAGPEPAHYRPLWLREKPT